MFASLFAKQCSDFTGLFRFINGEIFRLQTITSLISYPVKCNVKYNNEIKNTAIIPTLRTNISVHI